MLGSIDCMHWEWKNCPKAYHGQYTGKEGAPTLILEVVADYELWIWHAFFGLPGSLNDINVLNRSPVFSQLADDICPERTLESTAITWCASRLVTLSLTFLLKWEINFETQRRLFFSLLVQILRCLYSVTVTSLFAHPWGVMPRFPWSTFVSFSRKAW